MLLPQPLQRGAGPGASGGVAALLAALGHGAPGGMPMPGGMPPGMPDPDGDQGADMGLGAPLPGGGALPPQIQGLGPLAGQVAQGGAQLAQGISQLPAMVAALVASAVQGPNPAGAAAQVSPAPPVTPTGNGY